MFSGKDIYNTNCSVCHNEGTSGAPKIGDKAAWKPLIAQNVDVLVEHVMHNNKHPDNAGCKQCSTADVLAAIKYIISQSATEGNYSLW